MYIVLFNCWNVQAMQSSHVLCHPLSYRNEPYGIIGLNVYIHICRVFCNIYVCFNFVIMRTCTGAPNIWVHVWAIVPTLYILLLWAWPEIKTLLFIIIIIIKLAIGHNSKWKSSMTWLYSSRSNKGRCNYFGGNVIQSFWGNLVKRRNSSRMERMLPAQDP